MQTKQIIQSSANVIRITNIAKGNVYKRFDDSYAWFGVVKGVHNDGNSTVIEATEYRSSWSGIEVKDQIIRGEKDYIIFPATIDDFKAEFDNCADKIKRDIESAEKTIKEKQAQLELTLKLASGEMAKELSTPNFKEMTQEDFNEKLAQIAA